MSDSSISNVRRLVSSIQERKKCEKAGWLTKKGHNVKNWKRRWFVLKDTSLIYFKSPTVKQTNTNTTNTTNTNKQTQTNKTKQNKTQTKQKKLNL